MRKSLVLLSSVSSSVSAFFVNIQQTRNIRVLLYAGYVPDGIDPEEYKQLKKKEANSSKKTDRKAYKSRSFNSFVEALEKGEATHLFAVDPRKVKSGEVPIEDVPYMQRSGGSWDGSDLKGNALRRAKKKQSMGYYRAGKWLKSDFEYEKVNKQQKKEKNFLFLWFLRREEADDGDSVEERAKRNKISKDQQLWRDAGALSSKEVEKLKKNKINFFKKYD